MEFSVLPGSSQKTTPRLTIEYKCLVDSLGLLLSSSYNLTNPSFLSMPYHMTVSFYNTACSSCFSLNLLATPPFFIPMLSLCPQVPINLFLQSCWSCISLLNKIFPFPLSQYIRRLLKRAKFNYYRHLETGCADIHL